MGPAKNVKRAILINNYLVCFALFICTLPGCLGFSLQVRTVVDKRQTCLRQIDYGGSEWEHFLLPRSEPWKVTLLDSGATARAQFEHPREIGQDIIFDASYNLSDEKWQEYLAFADTSLIKSEGMRLVNEVDFFKNNYFLYRTYTYSETFDLNAIADYLQFEYFEKRLATESDTSLVTDAVFQELMAHRDTYTITCAVQLPGKVISSNASFVYEDIPIWEFNLNTAYDDMASLSIELVTREPVWTHIALILAVVLGALLFRLIRALHRTYRRHKDPFYRLMS